MPVLCDLVELAVGPLSPASASGVVPFAADFAAFVFLAVFAEPLGSRFLDFDDALARTVDLLLALRAFALALLFIAVFAVAFIAVLAAVRTPERARLWTRFFAVAFAAAFALLFAFALRDADRIAVFGAAVFGAILNDG